MPDFFDAQAVQFDFDELADQLLGQGLEASPALLHGCLCGLLSAGAPGEPEAGLDLLCQALEIDLYGELAGRVMELHTACAAALEDEEFDFHPLLPDDDLELELRTRAMADWARGFLAGFAQVNRAGVGEDSGEILADFAAIAEAAVDDEAGEDESEENYSQLVEYLRVAALNIYLDSRTDRPEDGDPAVH